MCIRDRVWAKPALEAADAAEAVGVQRTNNPGEAALALVPSAAGRSRLDGTEPPPRALAYLARE
eukprot:3991140-Prorocentrum_lima.AAC.1